MYINVDYNPTPSNAFFVSVGLTDTEALSFDYTLKGQRVTKQVLAANKDNKVDAPPKKATSEWDVLELKDGKLLNKRHVMWVDKGNIDEVNGEVWNTEWSKSLSDEVKDKLLFWSRFISDNYEQLEKYQKEMSDFEALIKSYVKEYNK